jgi:hypothetical protein
VNLARAEDEVGREIVLRLPIAERNMKKLIDEARNTTPLAETPVLSRAVFLQEIPNSESENEQP